MTHTEMVKEFADTFGVHTPKAPCLPDELTRNLRESLISEENFELSDAVTTVDALDAIADLLYVVHGAALAYGFTPEQVDAAFREVHRSNMSKLWTRDEADYNPCEGCVTMNVIGKPDMFVVKSPRGKVMKSPSYSPANLEAIVNGVSA